MRRIFQLIMLLSVSAYYDASCQTFGENDKIKVSRYVLNKIDRIQGEINLLRERTQALSFGDSIYSKELSEIRSTLNEVRVGLNNLDSLYVGKDSETEGSLDKMLTRIEKLSTSVSELNANLNSKLNQEDLGPLSERLANFENDFKSNSEKLGELNKELEVLSKKLEKSIDRYEVAENLVSNDITNVSIIISVMVGLYSLFITLFAPYFINKRFESKFTQLKSELNVGETSDSKTSD